MRPGRRRWRRGCRWRVSLCGRAARPTGQAGCRRRSSNRVWYVDGNWWRRRRPRLRGGIEQRLRLRVALRASGALREWISCILLLLESIRGWSCAALAFRRDVLVEAKEVGRVVAVLDRGEAVPGVVRVGGAHACRVLVAEEVHVGAGVGLLKRRGEFAEPALVGRLFVRAGVERRQRDEDLAWAVRERGG